MRRRLYQALAAVAILASGAATIGSWILTMEEPQALESMMD